MAPKLTAVRKWVPRLAAVILLLLAVVGADRLVAPRPRASLTLGGEDEAIWISPDGSTLVTHDAKFSTDTDWYGPGGGTLRVWDLKAGRPGVALQNAHDVWQGQTWFSPDGQRVCARAGNSTKVWDLASGTLLGELKELDDAGICRQCQGFSSDGRFVVLDKRQGCVGSGLGLEFRDVGLRQVQATLHSYLAIHWASGKPRFAAVHLTEAGKGIWNPDRVALYDLAETEPIVRSVVEHTLSGQEIFFSPTLDVFVTEDRSPDQEKEAVLTLRDMESGEVLAAGLPYGPLLSLEWMEFDRARRRLSFCGQVYSLDRQEIVRTDWDIDSGRWTQRRLRGHNQLSPDHRWLTDLQGDGLDLWDITTGEKRGRLLHAGDVPSKKWGAFKRLPDGALQETQIPGVELCFSKDSRFLFVTGLRRATPDPIYFDQRPSLKNPLGTSRSETVGRLWELQTPREVCTLVDCEGALLSADGQTLLTVVGL
jgi:WD40 repeat protein